MYNTYMITSVKNEIIKEFKKLKEEKDVLCLDNPKLIEEAINNGWEVLNVLKTPNFEKGFIKDEILVSENVLKLFTNTVTSQGVVAFLKYKNKQLKPPNGNFLILDNVQDPGNVGTLIRSAVGAGFCDVYLINCARVCLDKTVRSTMGALFKCNVYEVDYSFIDILKQWNKRIYVADMKGESIYNTTFADNLGLVIGNEGHGVSKSLRDVSTDLISLPMKGNLESLNAGVSGSIIMYQIMFGGNNVRS